MKGLVLWLNSSLHPKMLLVTMAIFTWSWHTSVDFREIITRKKDDGDVFLSVLVRGNVYKKLNEIQKAYCLPHRQPLLHAASITCWLLLSFWRKMFIKTGCTSVVSLTSPLWVCTNNHFCLPVRDLIYHLMWQFSGDQKLAFCEVLSFFQQGLSEDLGWLEK